MWVTLYVRQKKMPGCFPRKKEEATPVQEILFASVLSAGLVKGLSMKECAEKAARFLEKHCVRR